ncbi:hypothetical protein, partial [Sinorhizobium fredii]|uniref:hypothetical protein n=1 Tax=Rhizobium fredii TaxID=380 RepID=UPI001AEC5448
FPDAIQRSYRRPATVQLLQNHYGLIAPDIPTDTGRFSGAAAVNAHRKSRLRLTFLRGLFELDEYPISNAAPERLSLCP